MIESWLPKSALKIVMTTAFGNLSGQHKTWAARSNMASLAQPPAAELDQAGARLLHLSPLDSPRDAHSLLTVSRSSSARRSTPGPAPSRSANTR